MRMEGACRRNECLRAAEKTKSQQCINWLCSMSGGGAAKGEDKWTASRDYFKVRSSKVVLCSLLFR